MIEDFDFDNTINQENEFLNEATIKKIHSQNTSSLSQGKPKKIINHSIYF
jgi:hypothetical protein